MPFFTEEIILQYCKKNFSLTAITAMERILWEKTSQFVNPMWTKYYLYITKQGKAKQNRICLWLSQYQ